MKLRIRGDSLRLRVGPGEAKRVAAGEAVQESISFGPRVQETLTYSLEASDQVDELHAILEANCIRIRLPLQVARSWFEGDSIGIEQSQPIDQVRSLKLLIEKDFECLDRGENEEALYPNPARLSSCPAEAR